MCLVKLVQHDDNHNRQYKTDSTVPDDFVLEIPEETRETRQAITPRQAQEHTTPRWVSVGTPIWAF